MLTRSLATERTRFPFVIVVPVFGLAAAAGAVVWLLGSSNPFTPAGYVGYLTKGAVVGQARFYAVQRGPTSPDGPGCSGQTTSA